nr:MAG TPA: DNA N-6-adenine-methyltransferase [Caudoviricetes sp.]
MNKVLFSSKKEDWETPKKLFDELDNEFHFTLDPCANEFNHKCDNYYTIDDDGLKQDWNGQTVFVNPPYGKKLYDWVEKCYKESKKPNTTIVLLIPSRTDTRYFHEFLYKKNNVEIRFLKGRLKFEKAKYPAPFPSLIAIMKGE